MAKLIINASMVPKRKGADDILNDLDEISIYDDDPVLISRHKPKKEKKEDKDVVPEDVMDATDDWLDTVDTFHKSDLKVVKRGSSGIFDFMDLDERKGKKKKSKKKKDEMPDYKKEFEHDINYLQNILEDQTKFTASLQKRFDSIDGTKSAARGVGKFTTDLIGQINQARKTSFDIAHGIVGIKKSIADLQMKAKKDFMATVDEDGNVALDSAAFMRNLLKQNPADFAAFGKDATPMDATEQMLFGAIDDELNAYDDDERTDEVEAYMKYGTNVDIEVKVDKNTNEYEFVAVDRRTGQDIYDYPLPEAGQLSFNESTGYASDEYYQRYKIRYA